MPRIRLVHVLLCLLLPCMPACQSFYSYRPITIQTRDAETGQPISSAVVHISYPLMHASQGPYESVDATGPNGLVHLRAAPAGEAGILVEAKAHGYMPEQQTIPVSVLRDIPTAGWFEDVSKRPPTMTIDLYAEPRPTAELVLPAGFRGMLEVQIKTDRKLIERGRRDFTIAVPMTGKVEHWGPPLLARVGATGYRARYTDGTKLSCDAKGLEIGLWALNADGTHLTFLVGTREEFEIRRREALANDAAIRDSAPSGKSSHGGGRHGGRKNNPDTAPTMGGL
jgi:hypothetical protein